MVRRIRAVGGRRGQVLPERAAVCAQEGLCRGLRHDSGEMMLEIALFRVWQRKQSPERPPLVRSPMCDRPTSSCPSMVGTNPSPLVKSGFDASTAALYPPSRLRTIPTPAIRIVTPRRMRYLTPPSSPGFTTRYSKCTVCTSNSEFFHSEIQMGRNYHFRPS